MTTYIIPFTILKDFFSDKKFTFHRLKTESVEKYSHVLHRLIFNCLQFYVMKEWTSKYKYPNIESLQLAVLKGLYQSLEPGNDDLEDRYHDVCYMLFAHEKHQHETSWKANKFFSPVICFVVLHCITEKGALEFQMLLLRLCMPFMHVYLEKCLCAFLKNEYRMPKL